MQTQVVKPGAALPPRHLKGVEHHLGAHVAGHSPADDLATEDVSDETDVGDAFPRGNVSQVRDPELVGCRSGEVAFDQIW